MGTLYTDNFTGTSYSSDWANPGGVDWSVSSNTLSYLYMGNFAPDPISLQLKESVTSGWSNNIEVSCLVGIGALNGTGNHADDGSVSSARIGVSVANHGDLANGLSFVINNTNDSVAFYTGNTIRTRFDYDSSAGGWFWVKLRYSPTTGGYAKIWPQTGTEPTTWPFTYVPTGLSGNSPGVSTGAATIAYFKSFSVSDWVDNPIDVIDSGHGGTPPTLSITGFLPDSSQATLVTAGVTGTANSSTPLYIHDWNPIDNGVHAFNLFIKQSSVYTNYHTTSPFPPMFVRGTAGVEFNSKANYPPLYINGFVNYSNSHLNLVIGNYIVQSVVPLTITGDDHPTYRLHNNVALSTSGSSPVVQNVALFVYNGISSSDNIFNPMKLFVRGPQPLTTGNSQVPLSIKGDTYKPFNRPLTYLYLWAGDRRSDYLGLYLQTDAVPTLSSASPLTIGGGTHPGNYRLVPLNIVGSVMKETMNLVIAGKDEGGTSRIIRFVVRGGNPSLQGSSPLVMFNDSEFAATDSPLFIKGDGVNMNYVPHGESVGLYIKRGPQNGISLVMCNSGYDASTFLFIYGAPAVQSSLPMLVDGFGGESSLTSSLFVKGDVFTNVSGPCTLVVPKVLGFTPQSANLYTNGFRY